MNKQEVEAFARQTLLDHGMYSVPIDPVILANQLGIRVSNAVFSEHSISGMIAKRGDRNSLLINDNDSPQRKRFTIAHELGHYYLHLKDDGEFVDNEIDLFRTDADQQTFRQHFKEIQANQFAAALLMDAELVKKFWPECKSIKKMAELFKVSESAMGIRLSSLELV